LQFVMNAQTGRSVRVVYNDDGSFTIYQTHLVQGDEEPVEHYVTIDITTLATIAEESGIADVEYVNDDGPE
jgi:hypothetical protein